MLKKRKSIISFSMIILIIGGSLIFMNYQEKKNDKAQYFTEQENRVEKFLSYNIPEYKSVRFTKRYFTPMGIAHVDGYINSDKKLSFSASVSPNTNNFEKAIIVTEEFEQLMNIDTKKYSEIIGEEKNER